MISHLTTTHCTECLVNDSVVSTLSDQIDLYIFLANKTCINEVIENSVKFDIT